MTKLRESLEDWVKGKSEFMYFWVKEYGIDGVVEICQFLAENENSVGFGFTEKGDFLAKIGYNSGLTGEEFANGLLRAASYTSDNMNAFMINSIRFSRSINRAIIKHANFNSDENIETYFNLVKSYNHFGIPLSWEEAESISRLILQEINSGKKTSRNRAIDCAYSLSLPTMASLLIETYNGRADKYPEVSGQRELLSIVLHVLIWPYPIENTSNDNIGISIDLVIGATQKLPVTNFLSRLLKKELLESGNRINTEWYKKYTNQIQGESSKLILNDALENNYAKVHSYIDRIAGNGTIQNELHNFLRQTLSEGMKDGDKMNRVSLVNYLAEMDSYCLKNYPLITEENVQIDPGLIKKLDDYIKYLAMLLMADFGSSSNPLSTPTPEILLNSIPELKSKQGIYLLTQKIKSIKDQKITKLLEDTREEISNPKDSNYPPKSHNGLESGKFKATDTMVMEALYKSIVSKMGEFGTEGDKMPDGYGEFGYEVTNPIPVNSIAGSRIYLNNLRTLDGKKIQFIRFGSTSAPNGTKPIDIYEITVDGKKIATLYISPYNKKNSILAPKGFKLDGLL